VTTPVAVSAMRLDRARELAAKGGIVKSGNMWLVPSESSDAIYRVMLAEDAEPTCTCEYFKACGIVCKHMLAAAIVAAGARSQ
jgi:SWIM zinc finger